MKKFITITVLAILALTACQQKVSPSTSLEENFQPLRILYPNSPERFTSGSGIAILWTHSTETIGKTVKLNIRLLGDDGVGGYTKVIQNIVTDWSVGVSNAGPSQGEWAWTIPQTLTPGKYVIQIDEVAENDVHYVDTSDYYFSVTKEIIGNADIAQHQFTINIMPVEFRLKEISNLDIEPNGTVEAVYLIKNHSTAIDWNLVVNIYSPQDILIRAVWKDTNEYYTPGTEFQIAAGSERELKITFELSSVYPSRVMSYGQTLPIEVEAFLTKGFPHDISKDKG